MAASDRIPATLCDEEDLAAFPCVKCGDERLGLTPRGWHRVRKGSPAECKDDDCYLNQDENAVRHAHKPIPDCAECGNTGIVGVQV